MYKEIDIEQWERKDIYAAFSSFNNPCTAVFTLNRTDESEASVGLAVVSALPKLSFMSIVADDG